MLLVHSGKRIQRAHYDCFSDAPEIKIPFPLLKECSGLLQSRKWVCMMEQHVHHVQLVSEPLIAILSICQMYEVLKLPLTGDFHICDIKGNESDGANIDFEL